MSEVCARRGSPSQLTYAAKSPLRGGGGVPNLGNLSKRILSQALPVHPGQLLASVATCMILDYLSSLDSERREEKQLHVHVAMSLFTMPLQSDQAYMLLR